MKLRRVRAQVVKELTQIVRDPTSLGLAVALPLVLMTLLGLAISLTVHDLPIVVQDLDQTPMSRQLTDLYRASLTYRVVAWPVQRGPQHALEENEARGVVIIPEHFERDVLRGQQAGSLPQTGGPQVQVLIDATDANTANIMRASLSALTSRYISGPPPAIGMQVRLWYNPGRSDRSFIGPGALVVGLALMPPLLASLALSRERETRTILQVYVSGVSAVEYLLGKLLAYVAIASLDWVLGMGIMFTVFGLRLRGDPTAFLCGSAAFLFTIIAFGTMVGARVPDQPTSIQAMQLGGFVLSFLLSGFIFPLNNIPPPFRYLSNVTPARYYIEITRDGFLRGGGWPAIGFCVAALCALGSFFFLMAWIRMRRMQLEA